MRTLAVLLRRFLKRRKWEKAKALNIYAAAAPKSGLKEFAGFLPTFGS